MTQTYDLYATSGLLLASGKSASWIAARQQLDADDVVWAVEEAGRCDDGLTVAVPSGSGLPAELVLGVEGR